MHLRAAWAWIFTQYLPISGQRQCGPADLLVHRLPAQHGRTRPTVNEDGTPKWRMAPSPHGPYWEEGMKLGYQDCGSWTLHEEHAPGPPQGRLAVCPVLCGQDHSLKKAHVGLTPIRDSDIRHESFTERAPKLGGLVEFYRSPARVAWTPTGTNVPDYPKLAQLWWQNIGEAVSGEVTVDTAMDNLAKEMDRVWNASPAPGPGRLRSQAEHEKDDEYWLNQPGSPKAKLANEKPKGETVDYDKLIEAWRAGKVK
jgi:glycerol transport system substrate-binding protein